jgi:2-polyprenyl-3-methyl-5-hydroxy-6-metoxy-1,4-benzoquinol methylase
MAGEETIYTDGRYLEHNPQWHEEDAAWKARNIELMIRKHGLESTTIAEIGCGAGGVLMALTNALGPNVSATGFEVSPQAFELAKPRETANVKFLFGQSLTELEERFDLVLVIDVLEHLEDYFSFLRQVRPLGRHKIFHFPLDLSAQSVLRGRPLMKWRAEVGHLHYFVKETALASLRETGYRVIDSFYTNTNLELGNRGWKADLMKWPRRMLLRLHPDFAVRLLGGFSLMVLAE